MDSIEMKINEFRNAVSKLASDWIDTGFVSMVVEGATSVVKAIDAITNAIGGLASTITVLLGLLTGKNLMDKILGTTNSDGSKKDWWWKTLKEFTEGVKGVTQEGFEEAVNTKAVDDNTRSLEANSAAQVRNNAVKGEGALVNATDTVAEDANSASNLENATSNDIDTASQNANNASKIAGATANSTEGTSYMGGKLRSLGGLLGKGGAALASTKLGTALGLTATGGSLLIGGGILAAVGALGYFITAEQRAEKEAKAIAEAYKEAEGNIKSATDEMNKAKSIDVEEKAKAFSDLAKGVNLETNANISLTTEQYEEFLSVSKEIAELYPELTNGYDENGNALLDLSSDVDTVTESLKRLKDQQIADAEQEVVNNLDSYVEGYEQNIETLNKSKEDQEYDKNEFKDNIKELKELEKEYPHIIERINKDNGDAIFRINSGYADTSGDVYSKFTNLLSELGIEPSSEKFMYSNWTSEKGTIEEASGTEIVIKRMNDTLTSAEENKRKAVDASIESFDNQRKKANEELNQNLLAWVHRTGTYDNENLQPIIDQLVKGINWETTGWEKLDGDTSLEKMQNYIQNNLLSSLDSLNISAPDLVEELNNALSLSPDDTGLQEYVDKIKSVQEDLESQGYTDINLNFVIEDEEKLLSDVENNLIKNTAKLSVTPGLSKEEIDKAKEMQEADLKVLKDYMAEKGINTKEQLEEWNYYTSGLNGVGANKTIETYEKGIATAEQGSARVSKIMQDYDMVLDEAIQKVTKDLPEGIDNADISDKLVEIFTKNGNSLLDLIPGKKEVSKKAKEAYNALEEENKKIKDWGLSEYGDAFNSKDFTKAKFGNVDMNQRKVITWTKKEIAKQSKALKSWNYNPELGSVDTVFGGSNRFGEKVLKNGVEVAFTPIVNGKMLDKESVFDYIEGLVAKSTTDGKLDISKLIDMDKSQKGIIAAVDESLNYDNNSNKAETIGRLMHFSGDYGAIGLERQKLEEEAEKLNITTDELIARIRDGENVGSDAIQSIIDRFDVTSITELEKCLVELDKLSSYVKPDDLLQYMKSYQVTELAKQIDDLWNSEDFNDKRKDLEKLARTTGVTANDVKSLAEENEVLSDVLDTSGMSAEYLANCLNTMCLDGSSAMDTLNSDVMELNRVFDLMTGRIKEADDAYSKWKASTEQGDYDDQYKNVQEVYKDLEERLKNGDMGKNTRRDVEFLFGKGHGNDTFDEIVKLVKQNKKFVAEDVWNDDGTKVKKTGGEYGTKFIKYLAENFSKEIADLGDSVSYDKKTGQWSWDIAPENIDKIAEMAGVSSNFVTAMLEATGKVGKIKNYDLDALEETITNKLNMSVKYGKKGKVAVSKQGLESLLQQTGYEDWFIEQVMESVQTEMDNVKTLDFEDKSKENINNIIDTLVKAGKLTDVSNGVNLQELVNALSQMNMPTDQIIEFAKAVPKAKQVVDDFGHTYKKNMIEGAIKNNPTALLSAGFLDIKYAAEQASATLESFNTNQKEGFKLQGKDFSLNMESTDIDDVESQIERWTKMLEPYKEVNKNGDTVINWNKNKEEITAVANGLIGLISLKQKLVRENTEIFSVDTTNLDETQTKFIEQANQIQDLADTYEVKLTFGEDTTAIKEQILMAMGNFKETAKNAGVSIFDIIDTSDMSKFDESLSQWTKGIKDEDLAESMGVDDFDKKTKKSIATLADNLNKVFTGEQELKIKLVLDGKSTDIKILGGIFGGGTTTTTTSVSDAMNGDSRFSTTSSSDAPLTPEELVKKRFGIKPKAHGTNSDGIEKDQIALVNELGNETIVRDGELFEMKGGAHFEKLQKGDIIFNHKQTEELKKKGKLSNNGRGKLIGGSSAFASGTFKGSIAQISNAFSGESASNTGGTIKHYVSDDDKDNKKNKKSPSKETFDWIEVLLSRIQRTIAKLETSVNNVYIAWRKREQDLKREEKNVKKEISYQEQGAKRYQREANKYVGGIRKYAGSKKKGDDYIKKIQEGRIDIETIKYTSGEDGKKTNKEQLVEKLKLYQQWFEKSIACKDAVEELKIKESELAKQRFDNIVSKYDDKLSNYSNEKSVLEEKINQRQAIRSAKPLKEQKSLDIASIKDYQSLIKNTQQQANMLNTKSKKMQESFNKAVSSGKILKGSSAWYEMRNAIEAVKQEEQQCTSEILNYNEAIRGLYVEQFDKITERFENMLAVNEHKSNMLNESINQAGMKGQIISDSYYKKLIAVEENNNEKLKKQREQQRDSLEQAMKDGTVVQGDENWYKMTAAIDATTEAIQKSNTTLLEYNNNLKNLAYERFEFLQEQISSLNDEADFLIELMSDENIFNTVKEKDGKVIGGEITSEGQATLGLHGQKMNTYMSQAEYYKNEAAKIDENTTNKEDLAKRKEYIKLQQDSILNAKKEKQAMKSLVQEGYQKQLEALKKTIDLYNKSLDSQKSLYDYQKNIRDQSKNVTDIQKQLAAYEGDTSEESRAKVQELKKNLKEAQENLKETEYEHYISSQKELLDDVYDKYEQNLNDALENTDKLIGEVVTGINKNADTINTTLNTKLTEVGSSMSSAMSTVWNSNTPLSSSWGKITNNTGVGVAINGIDESVQNLITSWAKGSEHANPGSATEQYTGETVPQTNPQTTTVNNPSTTTPQSKYSDKTLGGIIAEYKKKDNPKKLSKKKKEKLKSKIGTDLISYLKYKGYSTTKAALKDYYGVLFNSTKYTGTKNQNKKLLEAIKKSGYASGIRRIKENELAWTQEKGREAIIRPSDGAILTPLAKGDSVLKSSATSNLFDFANNPAEFINGLGLNMNGNPNVTQNTVTNNSNVNLEVTLPNVKNYEDFKYAMQHDKNFEKMIQSMTTDRLFGGSSLKKYR